MQMWEMFTEKAKSAVVAAPKEARRLGSAQADTEHLLLGILKQEDSGAAAILERLEVDLELLGQEVEAQSETSAQYPIEGNVPLSPRAKHVLQMALSEAKTLHHNYIGTEHILLALAREAHGLAARILRDFGVDADMIQREIVEYLGTGKPTRPGEVRSETPVVDQFSRDLCELAKKGELDPVIGRDKEIERVIQILSRRTKNNPCLIGAPGVGKTAIVEGLAQRIVSGDVPEPLKGKRIVALDLASVVAGTKYRGEFEERLKKIMDEVRNAGKSIICFIDELHTLVGAGAAEGAMDASNILRPALARGEMRCIGATTMDEYRKYIEKNPSLERRFQAVMVREPSEEETLAILKGLRERYEEHHGVRIADEALVAATKLSQRYITDRSLPDKAIDVVDEAASRVMLKWAMPPESLRNKLKEHGRLEKEKELAVRQNEFKRAGRLRDRQRELKNEIDFETEEWHEAREKAEKVVQVEDVAEVVSSWTGVPVKALSLEEMQNLLKMEEKLHERVVGQDEAIKTVSKAIRRSYAKVKDPNRPIGSFMFLGPTGVGKTLLARALAGFLFNDESALVRIDMSEYTERFSVSRLVGAPPGYVGYDEGGQLTEAVRRRPYTVVLLDEIEKAHPDVFNMLLQVMDDGRLTDSQGRVVDFKNCVIIMTSNLGLLTTDWRTPLGFRGGKERAQEERDYEEMKSKVLESVKKTFRPEFLNRLDATVVFRPLTPEQLEEIVELELKRLVKQVADQDLKLVISASVKAKLAKEGYDPNLGARPLKRAIQKLVEDPLSEALLSGVFKPGDEVLCTLEDGRVVVRLPGQEPVCAKDGSG